MLELISIHIPKTGGRSFHEILRNVYGQGLDKKTKAIHGHLTIAKVKGIIEEEHPKVITWVRDPVDRVISNYYFFMKRIREGKTTEKQRKKIDYSLPEYAGQVKRRNRMTEILHGIPLEDFYFIGLMERFEEDIIELASKIGWPKIDSIPHINDSTSFKLNNDCKTQYNDIDENMRQEIAKLNELDIKLFDDIKNLRGIK
ncbi:MAG: sulfotransferase family 2 domain-containing protein [Bacteroidota bacterium]|nr:sulfotransferase family 2 domain-containing protein [Bacteroidota bacterium]